MKTVRLNLFIAQSGLCSRRKADELITTGKITVNHWPVTDPAYKLQEKDTVRHEKTIIKPEKLSYVLLYKPAGYVTTVEDQFKRPTVIDLLDKNIKSRVYPVGRLDYDTSGIILLTNDGALAQSLAHPTSNVKKVYRVTLKQEVSFDDGEKLKKGVYLPDGPAKVDTLHQGYNKKIVQVTLHSGRNRIIRRMFESLGYTVKKLERVIYAGLTTRGVKLGDWRFLTPSEVKKLKAMQQAPKEKTVAPKKTIGTGTKKKSSPKKKLASRPRTKGPRKSSSYPSKASKNRVKKRSTE